MRKTKSEGKTVGIFAISSQGCEIRTAKFRKPGCHFALRNFANQGAISHCEISQTRVPFRNAKFRKPGCHFAMRNFANHGVISQCEISQTMVSFRNAKFRKPWCHFAMRNFANHFDAFVRQMNSVLWLQNFRNAKFAMRSWQTTFRNAKWLRTVCEQFAKIPVLLFLF